LGGVPTRPSIIFYCVPGNTLCPRKYRYLAQQALSQWTCYGCGREVLKAICEQVFGLKVD
jgi:hypothetical protein